MKVEGWFFAGGVPIFLTFAIVYGSVTHWDEPVGTSGLFLLTGLAALIGAYLLYLGRHVDPRPEDDSWGEIAEGAGELGEFSPYSWWPLAAGLGGAILFAGLAVGFWLVIIGIGFGAFAVVGLVFEYYRGDHAH